MRKISILVFLVHFVFSSLAQLKKNTDGIEVNFVGKDGHLGQTLLIKIINPSTFRVLAYLPGENPFVTQNLVVPEGTEDFNGKWDFSESDSHYVIKTSEASAHVNKQNGAVSFKDNSGKILLAERSRDVATFTPDSYNGDAFYKVKQTFEVDQTEGLYGLGQHQNGVMNYNNGRQVTLLQYNTMIGIPFLYSTKNYGLLWHNYSITKAGDVRPLQALSGLKLTSAEGQEGWITVKYFDKENTEKLIFTRPESEISYLYLTDQDRLPKEVELAKSVAIYEGKIESPYSGLHRFHFNYSGYLKVWIDGELKEDRWRESWNAGSFEIDLMMEKGKKHDLKMEWKPDGGQAYLGLRYQSPIPENLKNTFSFDSEAGNAIDYYFIAGQNGDEVIKGYRTLTGKAPVLPKWSFGYWQSRERYKTQEEVENVALEFRKRKIPIDNIVQDWSYWAEHDWGSHDFDKKRFPDPKGMIDLLHKNNYHLMISVWPKVNEESSVYEMMRNKGWLYMRNIYDARKDWIGKGYTSTFYDPFNAEARKGFWNLMDKKLYKIGVDAWWMDASEPDLHSNINMEERKSVMQPILGSSVRYYNAFPLENARGIHEGQLETDPNNRVYILTRSFFAGQQRYSAVAWSGDISSRWHDFKDQISAGVNFSMSGTPYWTMDAGGFLVERRFHKPNSTDLEEWREMNARWFQYGAFLPFFRAHGQYPYREPFNIAPEGHSAYNSMTYYIKLRYKLLPYIYSLAGGVYFQDSQILRALAMDFPQDSNVFNINDQYLFGTSLLVNPVTEKGLTQREVYLPKDNVWYDLYTGENFNGGQKITAKAPYERIPVFVKAGSILPLGPEIQYTEEVKPKEIILAVYEGKDGEFKLYEDQGTNNDYQKGKYSTINFKYNDTTKELSIGKIEGDFEGMLKERTFKIVKISSGQKWGLDSSNAKYKTIKYKGSEVKVKIN